MSTAVEKTDPSLLNQPVIEIDLDDQLLLSLEQCITGDNLRDIRELLIKGANPNTCNSSGNRPIHLAIFKSPDNLDLVLELIRFGADVNVVNKHGSTPLTASLYKRCHQTIKILIQKRIDLNFQCKREWTPLMIAAMIGDLWSVRTLLQHNVNIDKFDITKRTALMYAVEGRYYKVIKELLAYGANHAMRDYRLRTALRVHLETGYPNLNIINELLLHCASFSNLENDCEASFRRVMKICMRGKPPYHRCVKTVVKIQMLETCDYHCVTDFKDLYDFALVCCAEVRYMKLYSIGVCNSVCSILRKCTRGYRPKEDDLEPMLTFVANGCFPVYSKILKALMRKPFIRKKFMKIPIYTVQEGHKDAIILNSDIKTRVLSYLPHEDTINFVLASYIQDNYEQIT